MRRSSTSPASPVTRQARRRSTPLGDAGWDVVVPGAPGFDGRSGFGAPTTISVARGRLGRARRHRRAPVPRCRRLAGGMIAADLAVFRPEAVTGSRCSARSASSTTQPRPRSLRRAGGRADAPPLRQGRARTVRRPLRRPRPGGRAGRPLPVRRGRCEPAVAAGRPRPRRPAPPPQLPGTGRSGATWTSCCLSPRRSAWADRWRAGGGRRRRWPSARVGRARRRRRPPRRVPRKRRRGGLPAASLPH